MTRRGTNEPDDPSGGHPGDDPDDGRGDATGKSLPGDVSSRGGDSSRGDADDAVRMFDGFDGIDDSDGDGLDEADDADDENPAPISAYERPWRHPSELGPLVHHIETATYPGRNLIAASAVIGLAFAVVLVRLVTAEGAGRSASVQTTTSVRSQQVLPAGATSQLAASPVAPPATSTIAAATDATAGVLVSSVVTTSTAAVATTTSRIKSAASSTLQPAGQRLRRSGVAVNDGSQLITTSKGLTIHARIDVVLSDGAKRTGEVVEIRPDSSLALVTLDAPADTPKVAEVDPTESHYRVDVGGVDVPCKLAVRSDGMVVTLDDDDQDSITEGSPIMASDGDVVGLTTWTTGSPHVVPVAAAVDAFRQTGAARQTTGSSLQAPTRATEPPSSEAPLDSVPTATMASEQTVGTSGTIAGAQTAVTSTPIGAPGSGWFGILGVDTADGVRVTGVLVGSPAQAAGLVPNSVIVSYGGTTITSIDQLAKIVHAGQSGSVIDVGYRLPGSTTVVHVSVTLAPAA